MSGSALGAVDGANGQADADEGQGDEEPVALGDHELAAEEVSGMSSLRGWAFEEDHGNEGSEHVEALQPEDEGEDRESSIRRRRRLAK